jgi:microcystin-dependent protein
MTPYIGEIRLFAGTFAPLGWAFCNGRLIAIADYETLFNLIGTTYGGDGIQNFALPDLRGRVPLTHGQAPGLSSYTIGQMGGSETVTLSVSQMAGHSHPFLASEVAADSSSPSNALTAMPKVNGTACYVVQGAGDDAPLNAGTIAAEGGGQPHDNIMPCLALNYIISLLGIYPSLS